MSKAYHNPTRFTDREKATADLYGTMHQTVPKLEARLQALLDERAEDVETMRERTTPWTAFVAEDASDPNKLRRVRSGGRGRIGKIERVRSNTEGAAHDNGEALAMFERWADEVVSHSLLPGLQLLIADNRKHTLRARLGASKHRSRTRTASAPSSPAVSC